MKFTAIYFSPTGNSQKSAESIASALAGDNNYGNLNLTPHSQGSIKATFSSNDFVVFGMPVYGGRLPKLAAERLRLLHGDKTPCIISVSYGNREYEDALLELYDIVQNNGFIVQAAAALVGQHTYGNIQPGRPNADDIDENKKFVQNFLANANGNYSRSNLNLHIKGNHPYRDEFKGSGFIPRTNDKCVKCKICVKQCPTAAIGEDCISINPEICLSCFRCIKICPVHAKVMDNEKYLAFAEMFSQKLAIPKSNEYFLSQAKQ